MHHELRLSVTRDGKKYNLYDFFVIPGNRRRRFVVDGYIWPGLHTPAVTGDFASMKAAQDWFEKATGIRPPRWRKSLKLGQNSIAKREAIIATKNPSRFADIKAALSAMGINIKKTGYGGEMRVSFKGAKTSEGYFTDDLEDAFGTGKLMADEAAKKKYRANPMKRRATKKPAFGKKGAAKLRALPTKDHRRKRTAFSRKEAIIAMRNPSLGSNVTRFVVRAVKHDGDVMYFDGAHFRAKKKEACIVTAKAGDEIMRKLEDNYAVELQRGGVKYLDVVQA